jgi:GNAT superfamily N-acetyltransferase
MPVTENTDSPAVHEHDLGEQHLSGAMALSRAANWNQNEADWRMLLRLGRGFGLSTAGGGLVASIVVLPYGDEFAWMSMVLVSPEHRRLGYASRMLRLALAYLQSLGLAAVLDATPAGHEVYVQEGLRDTWSFQRYCLAEARPVSACQDVSGLQLRRPRGTGRNPALICPLGASLEALPRALAARLPEAALVADARKICGYLLGRDGREARRLGPCRRRCCPRRACSRTRLRACLRPVHRPRRPSREPAQLGAAAGFQRAAAVHAHGARGRARARQQREPDAGGGPELGQP